MSSCGQTCAECTGWSEYSLDAQVILLVLLSFNSYQSLHDLSLLVTKPTKWHVCPAKTQISLGICPVWLESSLSARRKLWSLATHWAHSEDWSNWVDAQADLSLHWAHRSFCSFWHAVAHMISWRTLANLSMPDSMVYFQQLFVFKFCQIRLLYVCLICSLTSQSTTMVISRWPVNLSTLFLGRLRCKSSTSIRLLCSKLKHKGARNNEVWILHGQKKTR